MILYTVMCDPRESANEIIVTTDDKSIAYETAITYLRNCNVGEDDYWKTDENFNRDRLEYGDDEFISKFCNNAWFDSPSFVVYDLNQIDHPTYK